MIVSLPLVEQLGQSIILTHGRAMYTCGGKMCRLNFTAYLSSPPRLVL